MSISPGVRLIMELLKEPGVDPDDVMTTCPSFFGLDGECTGLEIRTIDHWDDFTQEPLNDLDEMSEEVDINGPLTFDDDLLNNNDNIRKNSESLTFQVRMR